MAAGDEKLDLSRKPTILKSDLTADLVLGLEGEDGLLVVTYGCGGCSNDYETTLTIAYREGDFVVDGYVYAWDTRNGIGSCEINFIAGTAVITQGLEGEAQPVEGTFTPVKLADWSDARRPAACDP
jgi:hypothetical protein